MCYFCHAQQIMRRIEFVPEMSDAPVALRELVLEVLP
jgi:hypothetical protein